MEARHADRLGTQAQGGEASAHGQGNQAGQGKWTLTCLPSEARYSATLPLCFFMAVAEDMP